MKAKRLPTRLKSTRAVVVVPDRETAFDIKRRDVLRRAALVFAEDGFHQTSVNSLAARLGVSKPVLYYYAKNKDDLLYQCDQIVRDALFKAMESTHRTKISGMGKVRHFFNHYAEIMCGDFGRCLALVDHRALGREARQKQVLARRGVEEAVCQMIIEGQADGSIANCNPELAARVLFGAFNGIPRWFQRSGELRASDVAETYIDLLVTGLGRH
jgi:TetR/AcrR family transcriptional regulator, cholesterol catabolism regulator